MSDHAAGRSQARPRIIDIHAHLRPPKSLVQRFQKKDLPSRPAGTGEGGGGGITDKALGRILDDPAARLEDMERMGVDVSALTPAPPRGYYRLEPEMALALARAVNDYCAEVVAAHPKRFVGMGILPLQDVGRAIGEMERVVGDLGFRGVRINTNIAGMELDDPRMEAFYAAAQALDVLLFTHPQGFTQPERLKDFNMANAVGQPLESTLMTARLIFSGVLERHPKLKLFVSHGGGFLPFYIGRFDQCFEERAECRTRIGRPPSSYLGQIYYDTVVFKPESIGFLAQVAGVGQVMMGTDRPYDMGEKDPVALVRAVPGLSDADKAAILGGTAARLLGIG